MYQITKRNTRTTALIAVLIIALLLAACGKTDADKDKTPAPDPTPEPPQEEVASTDETPQSMFDKMMAKIEQPAMMELNAEILQDMYNLDATLFEQYSVNMPMMNVSTNEIAIFKVKDAKDIPTVEAAIEARAEVVQKQFESYLQDQYENAKNFKLVEHGNYVLFVISKEADAIVDEFNSFFK